MFIYESWPVYALALELRDVAARLSGTRVRGCANELDRLRRGAASIVLNLCEGALCKSRGRKLEFDGYALASAGECNGALQILVNAHPNRHLIMHGKRLCDRIGAMINGLIKSVEGWK